MMCTYDPAIVDSMIASGVVAVSYFASIYHKWYVTLQALVLSFFLSLLQARGPGLEWMRGLNGGRGVCDLHQCCIVKGQ